MKIWILSVLAALGLGYGAYNKPVNEKEKEKMLFKTVIGVMDQAHLKPVPIDDDFSEQVYNYYIEYMDVSKRFLVQQDLQQLEPYKYLIDDQAKTSSLEFFELSLDVLDQAIHRAEGIYKEMICYNFDFDKKEIYEAEAEKREYANTETELREAWRKMLKFDILNKMVRKIKSNEENAKEDEVKDMATIRMESIEEVKETFDDWFKRLYKLKRSDRFEGFLSSITKMYDPHSAYFNPQEKQDFDIRMGGRLEGIGARLMTDDDFTKVASIVPGGPAWKQKELEVDDIILSVQQDGEEEIVNLFGWRISDVVQKIRGTKGTTVNLFVRKKDGTEKVISIVRDEVIIDESFARSLILDITTEVEKVGYIKLPKFYSTFEKEDGNSCAVDVANEIKKLKDQNVNGIILDLRYNGGGSLHDVVKMSGLFIDEGPIVQVKSRDRKPYVYEDEDPTTQYDGPLIVMVNNMSASASEILAAAMQDYGRAVIVGSNTFGKGTVQRFLPLDRAVRSNQYGALGDVKMTMQKFYRINGGSTQLKGVTPDIVLPDQYSYIDVGEKEYDHAMAWTEIAPAEYTDNLSLSAPLDMWRKKSENRIASDPNFSLIKENAMRVKEGRDLSSYPLDLSGYKQFVDQREKEAEKFDDLFEEPIPGFEATNLVQDLEALQIDSSKIARNDTWIEGVEKDVYLYETMKIMKDILRDQKS